jgi:hypothetical protein
MLLNKWCFSNFVIILAWVSLKTGLIKEERVNLDIAYSLWKSRGVSCYLKSLEGV